MIKDRLLKNWTWIRAVYLLIGILLIFQAAIDDQWLGVLLGSYISAMGLFGFGCAGGSCAGGSCSVSKQKD